MITVDGNSRIKEVTPEAITIEVSEYETVQMEINGVLHTLYQGKPRPQAKPAPKKPAAKKAEPKKPEPKVEEPAKPKRVMPKPGPKGSRANKKVKKVKPKKPMLSDDSQHSIHTLSFDEKLKLIPKEIKEKYELLSKYIVDTYGCAPRQSFAMEGYRYDRKLLIGLSLSAEHIRVNGAIDPKVYRDTKMPVNLDKDAKHYAEIPAYLKVKSDKTAKQALRFIDDVMKANGVKKLKK